MIRLSIPICDSDDIWMAKQNIFPTVSIRMENNHLIATSTYYLLVTVHNDMVRVYKSAVYCSRQTSFSHSFIAPRSSVFDLIIS